MKKNKKRLSVIVHPLFLLFHEVFDTKATRIMHKYSYTKSQLHNLCKTP